MCASHSWIDILIEQHAKLQYGCMDLLATMMMIEIKESAFSNQDEPQYLIVETSELTQKNRSLTIVDQVINNLKTSSQISFRVCLLDSFTLNIQHHGKRMASQRNGSPDDHNIIEFLPLQRLARKILSPLIHLALSESESDHLRAASLQVNVTVVCSHLYLTIFAY
jgi:hypothetical protein